MQASFKPRARLLKLLGDQLIGTPQLAIFELVKNSYDADADKVEIIITNPEDKETGTIEITDFGGEGMDMDIITNIWLEPGADHKEIKREKGEKTKKHNRLPLGEKGVGRFAVHKLGQKILLVTKTKDSPELSLEIDWRKLDDCKYIEDAEIEIVENSDPTHFKNGITGTKIVISELNSDLTKSDIRSLYRNVQSIKSPFEFGETKLDSNVKGFDISLVVKDHPGWTDDLHDVRDIVSHALFKFTFIIEDGKWSSSYQFNPNEALKTKFKVESRNIDVENEFLEIVNKELKNLYNQDPKEFFSDLGTIIGELYVFDFDSDVTKFYSESGAVRMFLKENKGVRVYRDGIRVYNYGEPNDDWLEMDNRRVQKLSTGLNRGITIGAISLNLSQTSNLTEKTNREGFIENETFNKLKEVIQSSLGKFESLRILDKNRLRSLTKPEAKSSISDLQNPIEELKQLAEKNGWNEKLHPTINKVEKSYNSMRDIMLTAGMAGLNMAVAFHEIHRGIKDVKKMVAAEKDVKIIIKQFDRFELLLDTYANLLKKEKSKEITIKELLNNNIELADGRFEMHDITYSCPILTGEQTNYTVKAPSALLISAINNLIDNSIYWLDQRWGNEKDKKYINIGVSDEFDKGPAIIIADNGPGWRNISPEEMIKPFHTTKPGGLGIGLFYTNMVMEMIGGELLILNPGDIESPVPADGAVVALVFNGGTKCTK